MKTVAETTRGKLLARNTVLNLIGLAAPLPVGVVSIPFLIRGLGLDRFGVLTLMWVVVGYMSLFDLGLSRALTQVVADRLGAGQRQNVSGTIWTSIILISAFGIAFGVVLALLAPWLIASVLSIPARLQSETLRGTYLLAISLPFVLSMTGLRGILEALQRFGLINAVRIPSGAFSYLGPLAVLPFTSSLVAVVAVLVAGRIVTWLVHLIFCLHVMPELRNGIRIERKEVGPLFRFGGWVMISNVVSPLMVYLDRFMIASLASVTAVAYYATPMDVVTKLLLVPTAVAGVLFPAFAATFAQDRRRVSTLLERGMKYVFLIMFPLILVVVVFAHDGLTLWLHADFARHSARVLQWLAVGVLINGLAQIPFALVQGAGRPDISAKFHLIELPVYLGVAWWLIRARGVEGAAMAWVARVTIDALLLFIASKVALRSGPILDRKSAVTAILVLATLTLAFLPQGVAMKAVFVLLALATFGVASWFIILGPDERELVNHQLRAVLARSTFS